MYTKHFHLVIIANMASVKVCDSISTLVQFPLMPHEFQMKTDSLVRSVKSFSQNSSRILQRPTGTVSDFHTSMFFRNKRAQAPAPETQSMLKRMFSRKTAQAPRRNSATSTKQNPPKRTVPSPTRQTPRRATPTKGLSLFAQSTQPQSRQKRFPFRRTNKNRKSDVGSLSQSNSLKPKPQATAPNPHTPHSTQPQPAHTANIAINSTSSTQPSVATPSKPLQQVAPCRCAQQNGTQTKESNPPNETPKEPQENVGKAHNGNQQHHRNTNDTKHNGGDEPNKHEITGGKSTQSGGNNPPNETQKPKQGCKNAQHHKVADNEPVVAENSNVNSKSDVETNSQASGHADEADKKDSQQAPGVDDTAELKNGADGNKLDTKQSNDHQSQNAESTTHDEERHPSHKDASDNNRNKESDDMSEGDSPTRSLAASKDKSGKHTEPSEDKDETSNSATEKGHMENTDGNTHAEKSQPQKDTEKKDINTSNKTPNNNEPTSETTKADHKHSQQPTDTDGTVELNNGADTNKMNIKPHNDDQNENTEPTTSGVNKHSNAVTKGKPTHDGRHQGGHNNESNSNKTQEGEKSPETSTEGSSTKPQSTSKANC